MSISIGHSLLIYMVIGRSNHMTNRGHPPLPGPAAFMGARPGTLRDSVYRQQTVKSCILQPPQGYSLSPGGCYLIIVFNPDDSRLLIPVIKNQSAAGPRTSRKPGTALHLKLRSSLCSQSAVTQQDTKNCYLCTSSTTLPLQEECGNPLSASLEQQNF